MNLEGTFTLFKVMRYPDLTQMRAKQHDGELDSESSSSSDDFSDEEKHPQLSYRRKNRNGSSNHVAERKKKLFCKSSSSSSSEEECVDENKTSPPTSHEGRIKIRRIPLIPRNGEDALSCNGRDNGCDGDSLPLPSNICRNKCASNNTMSHTRTISASVPVPICTDKKLYYDEEDLAQLSAEFEMCTRRMRIRITRNLPEDGSIVLSDDKADEEDLIIFRDGGGLVKENTVVEVEEQPDMFEMEF